MFRMRFALMILLGSTGGAAAQEPPGDAAFCRSYAASTAIVARDAIAMNGSCQDFSKGVHDVETMHREWCGRTPRGEVEGAATHIRRLASQCTGGRIARPTDYGGYDIAGNERFERAYGEARGWRVSAAMSGRTLMYCAATSPDERVRIGRDLVEPGDSAQWQLAVPLKSRKDWQGSFEVDGRGSDKGATDVSGTAVGDWTIAWFSMAEVDAVRQGKQAVLGVGKADVAFSLEGVAAALTKVEECVARNGVSPAGARTAAADPAPAAGGLGATVAYPFDIQVTTSPKAQAKLRKIDEKVKISAMYSGEPVPAKAKLANEVGEISLGEENVVLPLMGGNARLKGELPGKKAGWVKAPRLLINVVSARTSFPDNLLNCDLFDDALEKAHKEGIEIHCKLIGE